MDTNALETDSLQETNTGSTLSSNGVLYPPAGEPLPPAVVLTPREALTDSQRTLLGAYMLEGNLKEACRQAHVTTQTHYTWIRSSEAYRDQWQTVSGALLEEARARLDALLPRAADVFEEALEETAPLDVTCPACEYEFQIRIPSRNRLAAAKDLFKRSGDLAAKVQVSGEVKHRDMALEDRLALAQVQQWERQGRQGACPVPPDVIDDLQRRGALGQGSNTRIDSAIRTIAQAQVSEGEYQELPDPNPDYSS